MSDILHIDRVAGPISSGPSVARGDHEPTAARALHGTSPLDAKPPLDHEHEEALILKATARQPLELELTVEESGNLEELKFLLQAYGAGYFDIVHMSGHATLTDKGPRFLTESDTGETMLSSAKEIAAALRHLPARAFAYCVQELYQEKIADWHLLRLYVAGELPTALVTAPRTPGRKTTARPPAAERFLDAENRVKVPGREDFVGRRRPLQRLIKALRVQRDKIGAIIHGMGGLGKSSVAARICDRLTEFEHIVWVGTIDENSLAARLGDKLDQARRELLHNPNDELKYRLRDALADLERNLLLVLDDFEANFEYDAGNITLRDGKPLLSAEAKAVLEALDFALRETNGRHKLLITSRYEIETAETPRLYREQLKRFDPEDVQKKVSRIIKEKEQDYANREMRARAEQVADGIPREKAAILHNLATLDMSQGEEDRALALYGQVLEMNERIGNVQGQAATLHMIAMIHASRGNDDRALELLSQSLDIDERIGNFQGQAATLHDMAYIHAKRGEDDQALVLYRKSLEMKEKIGDVQGRASTLHNMASIHANRGEDDQALALFGLSLEINEKIGDVRGQAATLHQMGIIHAKRGEHDRALALFGQSLGMQKRIGNVQGQAYTLAMTAQLLANRGDLAGALARLDESLAMFERIGSPEAAKVRGLREQVKAMADGPEA